MDRSRRQLIILQALGGSAVLASYAWGFLANTAAMGALWGGVPEAARPLYTVNMFLAAGGFFLFAPYITFRGPREALESSEGHTRRWFPSCFALILIPSAIWLPLTALMIESPSTGLWWLVRLDLALVAAGALGLVRGLLTLEDPPPGRALALVGLIPFCVQTVVLDALIWPVYFTVTVTGA